MASPVRIAILSLCAGLALLGLALGAETQREYVLESDLETSRDVGSQAAGNLIVLTGVLVAAGVTGGVSLMSRLPVLRRLGPAAGLLLATYVFVLLAQSMWPHYVALVEQRNAVLANSLLVADLRGLPSVAFPPIALLLGSLLLGGLCAARLLARAAPIARPDGTDAADPAGLLRQQVAATLLAAPFLAVLAWGNLRLLLDLPDDRPGLGPAFVLLPAVTLACLALLGLALAKTWQLGTYVRNARLAAAAQESWQALGRAEGIVAVVLAALALAGSFLDPVQLDDLEIGRVLGFTLRSHTQALVFLAIPLAPAVAAHRAVTRALADAPVHAGNLDDGTHPLAKIALGTAIASTGLAALGTFTIATALWAWLLAFLPGAVLCALRCGPRASAPHLLLAALMLWAMGNTVQAVYAGGEGSAVLIFRSPTGLLALLRTLGAVVAAVALTRLALVLGAGRPGIWPLAAGGALATAAVGLLEMPLTAWLLARPDVDTIAVGSVVASLSPPVRAIVHTVATVLAVTAAILVALLQRPDWFARRPRRPVAAIRPKSTKAGRGATAPA